MKKGEKIFLSILFLCCVALVINACTDNMRAKSWGGKMTIQLEPGQKLVNVTWKEGDMWVLTKPMKPDEVAETYAFKEYSTYGILNGVVIINETGNVRARQ